jgi:hypothetical protein
VLNINPEEARIATGIFARMFPADEHGPGATEIGVVEYLDNALAGPYRDHVETYRLPLAAINRTSRQRYGTSFADSSLDRQAQSSSKSKRHLSWTCRTRARCIFRIDSDSPTRGPFLRSPEEENLTNKPVTKGGRIQSLADLDLISTRSTLHQYQKDYDLHESILSPSEIADVIVVDVGGVGGVIAPVLVVAD